MAVDGRLVRLERLDLSWTSITNDSFAAVGRLAGRRLRVMQARGCCLLGRKTITDAGVCALAAACAELEVLELYDYHGCSDVCAQALASCCPRLRVLKVPCCHAISDQGLVVPGSGWASSLRTLDVSYNGHVDDGCLARALAHLRCLLRLFVSGCKHISDEGLAEVAKAGGLLEALGMSSLPRLTNEGLARCIPLLVHLEELEVADTAMSDEGVASMARSGPLLRRLDVSNCPGISHAAVSALKRGPAGASLTWISVRGCGVGQGGLLALLGLSPLLRHVEADSALWTALEVRSTCACAHDTRSRPGSCGSEAASHLADARQAAEPAADARQAAEPAANQAALLSADQAVLLSAMATWELSLHNHVTGACTLSRRACCRCLPTSS